MIFCPEINNPNSFVLEKMKKRKKLFLFTVLPRFDGGDAFCWHVRFMFLFTVLPRFDGGDAFCWHVRFKFWKQEKPYWRANKSRSILRVFQKSVWNRSFFFLSEKTQKTFQTLQLKSNDQIIFSYSKFTVNK